MYFYDISIKSRKNKKIIIFILNTFFNQRGPLWDSIQYAPLVAVVVKAIQMEVFLIDLTREKLACKEQCRD